MIRCMLLLGLLIGLTSSLEAANNYETQAWNMALNWADSEWPDFEFKNRNINSVRVWYSWDVQCAPGAAACYNPMFQLIQMPRGYYPHVLMHEYLHHILFINNHPLSGEHHLPRSHHENEHLRNGMAGRR